MPCRFCAVAAKARRRCCKDAAQMCTCCADAAQVLCEPAFPIPPCPPSLVRRHLHTHTHAAFLIAASVTPNSFANTSMQMPGRCYAPPPPAPAPSLPRYVTHTYTDAVQNIVMKELCRCCADAVQMLQRCCADAVQMLCRPRCCVLRAPPLCAFPFPRS